MAEVTIQYKQAFVYLIQEIDCFELEDRKKIQAIVSDLHTNHTAAVESALTESAQTIVSNLIDKYPDRERVTFIGSYLRMFTDSPVLICGWLSLDNMKKLFQTIKDEDFNVQSDAIMTTQVCSL